MPQVEFGQFKSDKFDMKFNYELWVPEGLEVKSYTIGKNGKKSGTGKIIFPLASKRQTS